MIAVPRADRARGAAARTPMPLMCRMPVRAETPAA